MADLNSSTAVFKSGAKHLLRFLNLDETTPEEWQNEDLAAMVRHQLAAPLRADLQAGALGKSEAQGLDRDLTTAAARGINSFGDLLLHQAPPADLLKRSKEFFKKKAALSKKHSADWKIAFLFYNISVLAAWQHKFNISKLTPTDLLEFTKWAVKQDWVEPTIKDHLAHSLRLLRQEVPG